MRRQVVALALVALCLSACQSPGATPITEAESDSTFPSSAPPLEVDDSTSATPSTTPSPTGTPTPTLVPNPDFHTKSSCTTAVGKFPTMNKGHRFTAQAVVTNRGNIGASMQVKATWIGHATVHRGQIVNVGYGKSVKVIFNAPTSESGVAAFRANGPGRCEVTVKVLSFLGKPHATR